MKSNGGMKERASEKERELKINLNMLSLTNVFGFGIRR